MMIIHKVFQINLSTEHLFDHWLKSTTISLSRSKEDLLDLCLNEIQRNGRIFFCHRGRIGDMRG